MQRFGGVIAGAAILLFACSGGPAYGDTTNSLTHFQPVIMAGSGSSTITPQDSPTYRIDPNTTDSPFAGVGSLRLLLGGTTYLSTAVPVSRRVILTAAHSLDVDNTGTLDFQPSDVTFVLNYGGNMTHTIQAERLLIHPSFSGFSTTDLTHDDIAAIVLSQDLPVGVPHYRLYEGELPLSETLTLVGYGNSGYGDVGFSFADRADFYRKRVGRNNADVFVGDDDNPMGGANEIFLFDFDDPRITDPLDPVNHWGGLSLGNTIETQLGFGDSGGPSFVLQGGEWRLAGINTFMAQFSGGVPPPLFGSAGGGMLVPAYREWIESVPAPGAVGLALLGFGAIGCIRRRLS